MELPLSLEKLYMEATFLALRSHLTFRRLAKLKHTLYVPLWIRFLFANKEIKDLAKPFHMLEANTFSVCYKENGICMDCTSSLLSAAVPANCWVQRVSNAKRQQDEGAEEQQDRMDI